MLTGASPDKTAMNRQREGLCPGGSLSAGLPSKRSNRQRKRAEEVPRRFADFPGSLTRPAFLPFPAAGVSRNAPASVRSFPYASVRHPAANGRNGGGRKAIDVELVGGTIIGDERICGGQRRSLRFN